MGSAKISIWESRIDSNGEPYFPIYYDFPIGTGHSLDENSALVKPFRTILKEGKPPEEILFVFHEENENNYFVLGSFVKTMGNKILFFPGLRFSRIIHTPTGKDLKNEELHRWVVLYIIPVLLVHRLEQERLISSDSSIRR